jgi:hypothetical protein
MTPGERLYDIELIKSARAEAKRVAPRSRRVAHVLTQCADRLTALSAEAVIEQPAPPQPASTPDRT